VKNIDDYQIKAENVPSIISLISNLYYNVLLCEKNGIQTYQPVENSGKILKFIFKIALGEDDSNIDAILLLLCFNSMTDACVKLLKPSKPYVILDECYDECRERMDKKIVAVKTKTCCQM